MTQASIQDAPGALLRISLEDGRVLEVPEGTAACRLPGAKDGRLGLPFIAALVNNDLTSLSYPLQINARVRFLTFADPLGWRVYQRSLAFLVAKALRELFPRAEFSLQHSLGTGLYWSFRNNTHDGISWEQLQRLNDAMRDLVEQDLPIRRHKLSWEEALAHFAATEEDDKAELLRLRNPPHVVLHSCGGWSDLAHGPLAPSTGALGHFQLVDHDKGFVLNLPRREAPYDILPLEVEPHLFTIYQEHKEWGRILGVNTVGRLNTFIASGEIDAFMRTAEALHEQKVGTIAQRIAAERERVRVVLIAGPSSAGKTTFAKRLSTHLTVLGFRPLTLGTDDYFVGPEQTPRDAEGHYDFEHVEAVDLPFFNESLMRLVEGREIEVPTFNFQTKAREFNGRRMRLEDDQLLIVEGIHGLNPLLTEMVPPERKFRVFVSALTQLNLDRHNRIPTTDNRLMRRMVRDHRYRGHSALATLRSWTSVRRGEERWIFPFQREADATFNSALDYELAVLKPKVEPLLMQVKAYEAEYAEARRLAHFLYNFMAVEDKGVPRTSILREYIGGSAFKY